MNLNKLQEAMRQQGLNQLIVASPKQIDYLINRRFECGERLLVLVVKPDRAVLVLNELFPIDPINGVELVNYNDCDDGVKVVADLLDPGQVGVDGEWPSAFLIRLMKLYPELEISDETDIISDLRAIKNADEQEKMRKASQLNDQVMHEVRKLLKAGVSEAEVAAQIHDLFVAISGGDESFETIVAFKENCADPHCMPGNKVLQAGDSIVIDMGCKYQGYCSDMTRTFFIKENTMKEVYDLVLKANMAAKQAVKPGVRFCDIDEAARRVIRDGGYGEYFIHRLGHGIGMSVHEPYDVSGSNERIVKAGMCFSIEPGIYLPGVGGVRIEDLVLVTEDGCEVLNQYPYDIEVID